MRGVCTPPQRVAYQECLTLGQQRPLPLPQRLDAAASQFRFAKRSRKPWQAVYDFCIPDVFAIQAVGVHAGFQQIALGACRTTNLLAIWTLHLGPRNAREGFSAYGTLAA